MWCEIDSAGRCRAISGGNFRGRSPRVGLRQPRLKECSNNYDLVSDHYVDEWCTVVHGGTGSGRIRVNRRRAGPCVALSRGAVSHAITRVLRARKRQPACQVSTISPRRSSWRAAIKKTRPSPHAARPPLARLERGVSQGRTRAQPDHSRSGLIIGCPACPGRSRP